MEDYVTFGLARKLKEKGYPQNNCFRCYFVGDDKVRGCSVGDVIHRSHKGEKHLIAAPTIGQVLKWLREEHSINIEIKIWSEGWYCGLWSYEYSKEENGYIVRYEFQTIDYESYEQAALAGIEYVLDNLI